MAEEQTQAELFLDELPLVKELNPKQRAFILAYIDLKNATKAAAAAGYSERTAKVQGSRLLSNPRVRPALVELQDYLFRRQVMGKNEALSILSKMARARLSDYLNDDGSISLRKLKRSGVELQELSKTCGEDWETTKVKLRDPRQAIETLSKMLGWFEPEKTEEELTININIKENF
ncbi:MAG: terminase small subunit [Victivallales bacterium]|nr:terminase small subunit [Victivallales bacterium]